MLQLLLEFTSNTSKIILVQSKRDSWCVNTSEVRPIYYRIENMSPSRMDTLTIGSGVELNVIEVFTPTSFYFHYKEDWDNLDKLREDINKFYKTCPYLEELRVERVKVGDKVAVVWDQDGLWHRGIIRNILSVQKVEIEYMDYGTRTVTLRTRLYQLEPEYSNLDRMSHLGRLQGVSSTRTKWSSEASTRFNKLVTDEKDERGLVLHGKVMGCKEKGLELDLVYAESGVDMNIGNILVEEGYACYAGEKEDQLPAEDIPDSGAESLLPVLSGLGDCVAGAMKGPLSPRFQEEVDMMKEERARDKVTVQSDMRQEKSLVNKSIGLLLRILMEVKPLAEALKEVHFNNKDDDDEDDSGVDRRSVVTLSIESSSQENRSHPGASH